MTTAGVQYAHLGDATIAYRVLPGNGPHLLGIMSALPGVLASEHPVTRGYWDRVSRFARPVVFDVQGSGRSDPLPSGTPASVEHQAEEAIAVLVDAGIDHAYVEGWDAGGAVAITVASRRPDLVSGLVMVNSYARALADDDYQWGVDRSALDGYLKARRERHGTGFLLELVAPSVSTHSEVREFWTDCEQQIASPAQARELGAIAETLDVHALLPQVQVPALVIQTIDDTFMSAEHGRYLAAHLPSATYIEVPGTDHLVIWEAGEVVANEIETFITGVRPVARADRVLAAVLFTDLVGSTERARELGDHRWRRVLDEYDRVSSEHIDRCRGRLVKTTGDGVLASFGSASDAVECARSLQRAVRRLGLENRAGVHVGDVERRGDDIGGSTVNVAARVMATAGSGEVLLTMAAYEAAAGSGIRFSAMGEYSLKGLVESRPLYRVEQDEGRRGHET